MLRPYFFIFRFSFIIILFTGVRPHASEEENMRAAKSPVLPWEYSSPPTLVLQSSHGSTAVLQWCAERSTGQICHFWRAPMTTRRARTCLSP